MPKLPSGREIAISARRLVELAEQYEQTGEPAALADIANMKDLDSYIDLVFFRPRTGDRLASTGRSASSPAGLEPYESGYTLADRAQLTRDWPRADREALHSFLAEDRTRNHLAQVLKRVRLAQLARREPTPAALLQAVALTNPQQLGAEAGLQDVEPLALDTGRLKAYTLVALARIALRIKQYPELYAESVARFERLSAVIGLVLREGPAIAQIICDEQLTLDEMARRVQAAMAADGCAARTKVWLDGQLWHEVVNLWPAIDNQDAQALFPREHDVLEQAWLSPQMAQVVEESE